MHRSLVAATLALAAPVLVAATVAVAAPASADDTRTFRIPLLGSNEVPGPGDPDGAGRAVLVVNGTTGKICYKLTARNVAPLNAGHIHEKAEGSQAGPVVQPLVAPGQGKRTGPSEGCVVNLAVAQGILAEPTEYYVNLHNRKFPAGALRGNLP